MNLHGDARTYPNGRGLLAERIESVIDISAGCVWLQLRSPVLGMALSTVSAAVKRIRLGKRYRLVPIEPSSR
jgi:hypothetical protein